jgi:hypothetical protein
MWKALAGAAKQASHRPTAYGSAASRAFPGVPAVRPYVPIVSPNTVSAQRSVGEFASTGDRTSAMQDRLKVAETRSASGPSDAGVQT